MENDVEHIYVEFHNRARELFFSLFKKFNSSIEGVNRDRDEFIFRKQREQYITHLEQELKEIARDIITKHRQSQNLGLLSQNLQQYTADYLHQFIQKIKAL